MEASGSMLNKNGVSCGILAAHAPNVNLLFSDDGKCFSVLVQRKKAVCGSRCTEIFFFTSV